MLYDCIPMTTIHHIRKLIDQHRARLNEWGICKIGLFGSYVRGEELATTVDLVLKSNLKPAIRQTILSEVEYFF